MHRPRRAVGRTDGRLTAFLAVLGLLAITWLRAGLDAYATPLGSDPNLWCSTVLSLERGIVPMFPPLFPLLASVVDKLAGVDAVEAALLVSAAAYVLLPPATYRTARFLGASPPWALGAGLLVFAWPNLAVMGLQFQPDALTALVVTAAPVVFGRWLERPTGGRLAALAAFATVAHWTREHGLILAALAVAAAAVPAGSWKRRLGRMAAVLAVLVLAPLLLGHPPALPWRVTWMHRLKQATSFRENVPGASNYQVIETAITRYEQTGNRLVLAVAHARFSLGNVPWGWAAVGLGWLGTLLLRGPRRLAMLSALVLPLPAFVILTQPRHVEVAVPAALAAAVAGASRLRPRSWILALGVLAFVASHAAHRWRPRMGLWRGQATSLATRFPEGVCTQDDHELIRNPPNNPNERGQLRKGGGGPPARGRPGGRPGGEPPRSGFTPGRPGQPPRP